MKNRAIIDTYKNLYDLDLIVANKYTKLEQLKKLYSKEWLLHQDVKNVILVET